MTKAIAAQRPADGVFATSGLMDLFARFNSSVVAQNIRPRQAEIGCSFLHAGKQIVVGQRLTL